MIAKENRQILHTHGSPDLEDGFLYLTLASLGQADRPMPADLARAIIDELFALNEEIDQLS